MLVKQGRKSEPIIFGQANVQFLKLDNNKAIIGNTSPALSCGLRVVGAKRFNEARLAGYAADLVIVIPHAYLSYVENNKVCEVKFFDRKEKGIYTVKQVQDRFDSVPPCIQLTLQEEKEPYADKR